MNIIDCKQRSAEWFAIKAGRVSASRIADVVAKRKPPKGKTQEEMEELACRRNYRMEIVAERLTHQYSEHFVSSFMKNGMEFEDEARCTYARTLKPGYAVEEVGFVIHSAIGWAGCSPDGLVIDEWNNRIRGLELKCPQSATHVEYLESGVVPEESVPQMQWGMACTGLPEWDFVSYDGHRDTLGQHVMPKELRLFVRTLKRDDALIAEYEYEVCKFLAECSGMLDRIRNDADIRKHLHV